MIDESAITGREKNFLQDLWVFVLGLCVSSDSRRDEFGERKEIISRAANAIDARIRKRKATGKKSPSRTDPSGVERRELTRKAENKITIASLYFEDR